jgi:hypothetical protein
MANIWTNAVLSPAKSVGFSAVSNLSAENITRSMINKYKRRHNGELKYISERGYKNVYLFEAKRAAIRASKELVRTLLEKRNTAASKAARDALLKQQQENNTKLIEAGTASIAEDYGKLWINCVECSYEYVAKDISNRKVQEAMFLYYDLDTTYQLTVDDKTYNAYTLFHLDINPTVSVSSGKNIVQTTVQGRDYSRKELISGGDLTFTVEGEINSNEAGVYPTNDVAKFVELMQYNGILKVSNFMFGSFNVTQVIVKDYSLDQPTYKNIQPYKFTCVAVEPDEDVIITADTIRNINEVIASNNKSSWFNALLQDKLAQAKDEAVDMAGSTIASLLDLI